MKDEVSWNAMISGFAFRERAVEALSVFHRMSKEGRSACPALLSIVDLLACAGLIYDAWDFTEKMLEKPAEVALGALLGAWQKLGNIDVSEWIILLLLEMEPLISSKIYANSRRRDD
ncbi:hypothetical protein RJ639_022002, partial [Escallonia herrerae]